MPYTVTQLDNLFSQSPTDQSVEQTLTKHLNEMEKQGWRLHSVLPDTQRWDEEGERDGITPSQLIFYRDPEKKPGQASATFI